MLFPGSQSNYSKLTFDGVDVMGIRLAEEVCESFVSSPDLVNINKILVLNTNCSFELILSDLLTL